MSEVCFHAVGRRKKAIARVRLIPGEGNIIINKRSIDDYFGYETLKTVVRQPLVLTETNGRFDVIVNCKGRRLHRSGRRHPPRHRPRAGEGQRGIQARHQEGRLPHPRPAHEGAQEVRPEGRPSARPSSPSAKPYFVWDARRKFPAGFLSLERIKKPALGRAKVARGAGAGVVHKKSHGLEPGIPRGARQNLFSAAAFRP